MLYINDNSIKIHLIIFKLNREYTDRQIQRVTLFYNIQIHIKKLAIYVKTQKNWEMLNICKQTKLAFLELNPKLTIKFLKLRKSTILMLL